MDDWDRHLPQVMGAFNSTEHFTTGLSPHKLPLTFFYLEFDGKRTAPQTNVREFIRRQQDLNDLCRRNTQQAQIRQKGGLIKGLPMQKPTQLAITSGYSRK